MILFINFGLIVCFSGYCGSFKRETAPPII